MENVFCCGNLTKVLQKCLCLPTEIPNYIDIKLYNQVHFSVFFFFLKIVYLPPVGIFEILIQICLGYFVQGTLTTTVGSVLNLSISFLNWECCETVVLATSRHPLVWSCETTGPCGHG